jgi:uncharacterized protein (DUF488 family)
MLMSEKVILTIGYAGKSAEEFFSILGHLVVRRVIDVRLYNTSQLAGYTKRRDLEYFLKAIIGADYTHLPAFAPTRELLDGYKKGQLAWPDYERQYRSLLASRQPHISLNAAMLDHSCLLCAEPTADQCHRRLAAEYLQGIWPELTIQHL